MKEKRETAKNSFLKGAFILSAAGLVVKFLGAFFRIPLANLISTEAFGYYTAAYPIYAFFIAIATAGLPTAVARLVAESKARGNSATIPVIFRVSAAAMALIGIFGFFVIFIFAGSIARAIGNEGAALSLRILAPGTLFCSMLSVYRGYFQGFQRMNQFAVSMIVEQFIRVIFGLLLAGVLLGSGDEAAAGGATSGATLGGLAALVYIYFEYVRLSRHGMFYNPLGDRINAKLRSTAHDSLAVVFVRNRPEGAKNVLKNVLKIAVPITISASVLPLVGVIDVAMVVNILTGTGVEPDKAKELFTMMSGYAATLINFPLAILTGIQISVVPAITAVFSIRNQREVGRIARSAFKVTSLIALPSSIGLSVLSTPVIALLYPSQSGVVETTGSILAILSFSVFFLGGYLVSTSVYQSIEKPMVPVQNLAIGILVKVVLTYILTSIPSLNIYGATIATVCAYATAWLLGLVRLRVYADISYDIANTYVKPLIASAVMAIVAHFSYKLCMAVLAKSAVATLVAIFAAVVVYFFFVLWMRTLGKSDYEMLPGGKQIRALEYKIFKNRLKNAKKHL